MAGLPYGKIRLAAQNNDIDMPSSATEIGEINITAKQPATVIKKIERSIVDTHIDYLGFNGQIGEIAVPVNSGSSYLLLAGSSSLADNSDLESSSDLIAIAPTSFAGNFANHIRAVGFGVTIASNAPVGEYSLVLRTANGERRFLIGGITVEKFPNLWSTAIFK
jgi:hypothetical protein